MTWKSIAGEHADQWDEPDLDRGYIPHKRMTDKDLAEMRKSREFQKELNAVYDAAERFASECNKAGIAVTAEEWIAVGAE